MKEKGLERWGKEVETNIQKAYEGHATSHLSQACDLRRELECSYRRCGDAVKYLIGTLMVVHR